MIQDVDFIGIDSIAKQILLSKLSRFIVYRRGSVRGNTPVFNCDSTSQNSKAVEAFKGWAQNMLTANPQTVQEYEMLLFDKETDSDSIEDEERLEREGKKQPRKSNKIRFTFAFNSMQGFGGYGRQQPTVDIESAISIGIERALEKKELEEWRSGTRKKSGDEDEEEDDDEETGSTLNKVYAIIKEINKGKRKGAAVAGDEDEEEEEEEEDGEIDLDDEEEEKPKKKKGLAPEKKKNMLKALNVLWKHDERLDKDLLILARLAVKQPIVFDNVLEKLRNLKV
jgi:hypothetical protein